MASQDKELFSFPLETARHQGQRSCLFLSSFLFLLPKEPTRKRSCLLLFLLLCFLLSCPLETVSCPKKNSYFPPRLPKMANLSAFSLTSFYSHRERLSYVTWETNSRGSKHGFLLPRMKLPAVVWGRVMDVLNPCGGSGSCR